MNKDKLEKKHNCDNVNCNHNDTKGLCCLFNPDNCKYRQLQKENAEAKYLIEELASSLSVVGECDEEECELINKAQKFINKPIF